MSSREADAVALYQKHRLVHQRCYYDARRTEYLQAAAQLARAAQILVAIGAVGGALAAFDVAGARATWGVLSAVAAAVAAVIAAYDALYGFDRNAKLYGDAAAALDSAALQIPPQAADAAAVAEWCARVEDVLRREQGQWGQLTEEAERAAG